MTGWQCHLIDVARIPCIDDHTSIKRICFQSLHKYFELINFSHSISSLDAIDSSQVIFFHHLFLGLFIMAIGDFLRITSLISYVTISFLEPFFAINTFDKSFQFYGQNSHRNFLRGQQREAVSHVMSDRSARDSMSSDSCSIVFFWRLQNLLDEIEVLGIDMCHGLYV